MAWASIVRGETPPPAEKPLTAFERVAQRLVISRQKAPEGGGSRPSLGAEELEVIAKDTLRRCSSNSRGLQNLDLSGTVFTGLFVSQLDASAPSLCLWALRARQQLPSRLL